jgi:NitT/TauT family transport system permease protein
MLSKHTRMRKILGTMLVIVFWLAVWQIASMLMNQPLFIPSPYDTFSSLLLLLAGKVFWLSVAFTLYRVVLGLVISFVLGVVLAYIASRMHFIQSLLRPAVAAVKSVPVMSIVILAFVWFSCSFVPVFSCVLLCFPIFYTNTLAGIKSVDKELLELAEAFKIKRRRIITEINVPSVLPHVYSALSVCLGFSWKSVVAAEVLSIPQYSMGRNLFNTKQYLDTPQLFAWTIAIVIISLAVEKGLKRLLPGGKAI